jgi:hypothetical protein
MLTPSGLGVVEGVMMIALNTMVGFCSLTLAPLSRRERG